MKKRVFWTISHVVVGILVGILLVYPGRFAYDGIVFGNQMSTLAQMKEEIAEESNDTILLETKALAFDISDNDYSNPALDPAFTLRTPEELSGGESQDNSFQDEIDYFLNEVALSEEEDLKILSKYQSLYELNNDLVGWISIDNTSIDYPVMQTGEDRQWYYLRRDFYGENNQNGCIFLDERCDAGEGVSTNFYQNGSFPSTNLIIYGHRTLDGAMFGNLSKFLKQEYTDSHKVISFDTLYEERKYMIVAALRYHVLNEDEEGFRYYNFVNADSEEIFDVFKNFVDKYNQITPEREIVFGDEILTLSACYRYDETGTYNKNARIVIIAVRIQ